MAKILTVEDDTNLANLVRSFLLMENHQCDVIHNGREAMSHVKTYPYDVIILDWDLPEMSGLDILKEYRNSGGKTPILMLTGKDTIEQKEIGLDCGADDYLTKPFHMKELGARVRSLLRRPAGMVANSLNAANIVLDASKYRVVKDGQPITLLRKEFQLLEFLMRHPNQLFSSEALLNRVWPTDSDATPEALRTTIKRLRKKIDPDGDILRTVHGVGYIFESG